MTDRPDASPPPAHHHPRRSLLGNTVYAVAGTGFYHLCHLGVLMLLAKLASAEIQGEYLLSLAIAAPVILFFSFDLRSALVADAGNQFTFATYRALRSMMMVPAGIVLALVLGWRALAGHETAFVLISLGVFTAQIAWSLADVGWGTFQRRERLDLFAWSFVLRGVTLVAPFAVLLPLARQRVGTGALAADHMAQAAAAATVFYGVAYALVYVLFERRRVRDPQHWRREWDWAALRALAVQTFPLGLVALIINLCDTFPRWLFARPDVPNGAANLGYFGSLAFITLAGNLLIIQTCTAAANRLALYYQQNLGALLWLLARLVGLALAIGVAALGVAFFAGEWFLRVLYTPAYAAFVTEFQLIVVAQCLGLLTTVFGVATTQMRLFWMQVPAQVITLLATATAAWWLIPGPEPVYGGALTLLVRAGVQFGLYTVCIGTGLALRRRIAGAGQRIG